MAERQSAEEDHIRKGENGECGHLKEWLTPLDKGENEARFFKDIFCFVEFSLSLRKLQSVPISHIYRAPFHPACHYHMTFRSIDGVKLFLSVNDRLYYLRQFAEYFKPVMDCLAFNLLDNHSHFVVQVKEEQDLHQSISLISRQYRTKPMQVFLDKPSGKNVIGDLIERQVNSFMASYAKGTNELHSRKGGLFQSPFRRSFITSDSHLQHAIIYTHANAQKHGLVKDFKEHPYTSYHEILSGESKNVKAERVLDFFGGREMFVQVHHSQAEHYYKSTFD